MFVFCRDAFGFEQKGAKKKKGGSTKCTNVALHTTLKPCSLSCFMQNVIFSKCFLVYRLKTRSSVLLHSVRYWIHKILSKKTKGEQKCCWVALAPWIKYYTYRFNYEAQLLSSRNIKCKLLCSLAGFLFLDFPGGGIFRECGRFFFLWLLWLRILEPRKITRTCPVFL